jgi:hypothetical protein
MMTMEKAQRIIEVVVEGSQRNCRMRRTVIAGLLLAGSRRVKKLKQRKGGSFPTFLVLDGCCTTSLPWTLE